MDNPVYNFKNNKGKPVYITFAPEGLQCQDNSGTKLIKWSDFIGVYIPLNFDKLLKFELIYARETEMNYNKHGIHNLFKKNFVYLALFGESTKTIVEFRNKALENLYQYDQPEFSSKISQESDLPYFKKALVFINPHAGNGKALNHFKMAQKILSANGIFYDRVICQKDPFVKNLVRETDLDQFLSYDLIICISGDGIPHEIINGYFSRTDINFQKHSLTIALLPSGGGCALSENMLKLTHHQNTINNSLFKICHLKRKLVNIQKYDCLLYSTWF